MSYYAICVKRIDSNGRMNINGDNRPYFNCGVTQYFTIEQGSEVHIDTKLRNLQQSFVRYNRPPVAQFNDNNGAFYQYSQPFGYYWCEIFVIYSLGESTI